jgi:hypothetical protein
MNRRQLITAAPMLFTCACCCNNLAAATIDAQGCRRAAGGFSEYRGRILDRSQVELAPAFEGFAEDLRQRMEVHPDLYFYDDSADGMNALAIPPESRTTGSDGTVLIGANLTRYLRQRAEFLRGQDIWENDNLGKLYEQIGAREVIVAHEFGHIVQYKNGMSPNGPWEMEAHADFMAGWGLGSSPQHFVNGAAKLLFALGDIKFNDSHHGEPVLRQTMVRVGFDSRQLDVQAAFDKGLEMAHLR